MRILLKMTTSSAEFLFKSKVNKPSLTLGIRNSFKFKFQDIFCALTMEDGGVDRTVIDCWQNQMGPIANFPPLLTFSIFD